MKQPAPRPCTIVRSGGGERATWQLADDCLLLAGAAGTTALPLAELSAVAADELTVTVATPGETTALSRLGADASFLAAELRRRWLPARARALRLVGDGAPLQLAGAVATAPGAPLEGADLLVVGSSLVVARHGCDAAPLFLALVDRLELDGAAHAIVASGAGGGWRLGRLAGRTVELAERLAAVRTAMTAWSAAVLAAELPTLGVAARARLAAGWLPGRLLALASLAGDERAAVEAWLARSPRAREARALLDRADRDGAWLALTPPSGSEVPLDGPPAGEPPAVVLWLLVRRGAVLLLEAVTADDLATYRFAGGRELERQVAAMLCTTHFAREALYLPLAELSGERAALAVAARDLPYLAALRAAVGPRLIHRDPNSWRAELDAALS